MMSHVDVPMIRSSVRSRMPLPTAPAWASMIPAATGIPGASPKRSAHSGERPPTVRSDVAVSAATRSRTPASNGSTCVQNDSGGSPPQPAFHAPLCPAAQRFRRMSAARRTPVRSAGIQSLCSTHENAAARTFGETRRTWRIFAQNHSDE